jgi:radical SAM superfamily enzyme YgiQ (UPF0313 family)
MESDRVLALLCDVWTEITTVLEKPWETPAALSSMISALLQSSAYWEEEKFQQVEVAGSPDQHILCLMNDKQVVICSPQRGGGLLTHPFVRELVEEWNVHFETYVLVPNGDCLIAPLCERLSERLKLPSVMLVSLFHPEMYPATRLTLGIAYIASYLRLHHLAKVEMIDCQFGTGIDEVLTYVRQSQPDILGVSVNFGQFDLMEQLLDGIYDSEVTSEPPVVILGNILPAMCFREILTAYPEVMICRKEGELALATLTKYGRDRSRWHEIPGVYYLGHQGHLITTPPSYLPMEHLPTPALDTVAELFERDGVITAEFSRGCQYNQCSFCPRTHKGSIWRTVPVTSMLQQWEIFAQTFRHFQRTPHVFLADEDFVGREDGDATIRRITDFVDGAQERGLSITFDASCRADQIFREDRDQTWHTERGNLFKRCVNGRLSRLFLGVESGASAQLLRYNKGSTVDEMISAIRYLSLLGVRLRFGFIFFDPLMSVQDLIENIEFLGRTDIVLPARPHASVEEIFSLVSSNHQQVMQHPSRHAVYEDVSYMVSPLEVLSKSRYLFDLRQQAPQLMNEQIDVAFARYCTTYAIPEIGSICMACQCWVNYCFPIIYTAKGLQKVSAGEERRILHQAITGHRHLSYMLIRSLAQIFSLVDILTIQHWEQMHTGINGDIALCTMARKLVQAGYIDEAISNVLSWYEMQIRHLMERVNKHASDLSVHKRQVWRAAYNAWTARSLTATETLRMA